MKQEQEKKRKNVRKEGKQKIKTYKQKDKKRQGEE